MLNKKLKKQFLSYSAIGIISLSIDFIFYNILHYFFALNLSLSKALSFIIGSTNSFIFNKKITFKSQKKSLTEPFLFFLIYSFSLTVNYFSHKLMVDKFSGYIPFIIATTLSIMINFFGQKTIVFKK
jgi:putative flippase GtrA